ncbi:unnamed protein product [Owenia fusiformis]|uniref:Uncharacterized protein n=1 Tax=Owenia fusiformis TaxID=6347 RepID=A0A8J1TRA7_OWEFU|nr:unnamed protein product [Owenia fusiformis]
MARLSRIFQSTTLLGLLVCLSQTRGAIRGSVQPSDYENWTKRDGGCAGSDISSHSSVTLDDCYNICFSTGGCIAFYYDYTNRCFLKNANCNFPGGYPGYQIHYDPDSCKIPLINNDPIVIFETSTTQNDDHLQYGPYNAYIDSTGWTPAVSDASQFLQVTLRQLTTIDKMSTRGDGGSHWVTEYYLKHKPHAEVTSWTVRGPWQANINGDDVVTHLILPRINAIIVRLEIKSWHGVIALGLELYGCSAHDACSSELVATDNTALLTASSFEEGSEPDKAKIDFTGSWGLQLPASQDEWIQVEFSGLRIIDGIMTQGNPENRNRCTSYKVASRSIDGRNWIQQGGIHEELIDFTECKTDTLGDAYRGTLSVTNTGKTCQRWDSQSPHSHQVTDNSAVPDETLGDANNYCRNANSWQEGPWCYTTDSSTRWEYCDVQLCGNVKVYRKFGKRFLARFVRIYPVTWETKPDMRFELLGCNVQGGSTDLDIYNEGAYSTLGIMSMVDSQIETCMAVPTKGQHPDFIHFSLEDNSIDCGSDTDFFVVMKGTMDCAIGEMSVYGPDPAEAAATNLMEGKFQQCEVYAAGWTSNPGSCTFKCACNPCGKIGVAFFNLKPTMTWKICDIAIKSKTMF